MCGCVVCDKNVLPGSNCFFILYILVLSYNLKDFFKKVTHNTLNFSEYYLQKQIRALGIVTSLTCVPPGGSFL